MSNDFARIIETTFDVTDDGQEFGTWSEPIDLFGASGKADKFSVLVTATDGTSYIDLSVSNVGGDNQNDWYDLIDLELHLTEGQSGIFEQPNVAYRYFRIRNYTDTNPSTITCQALVVGSPM